MSTRTRAAIAAATLVVAAVIPVLGAGPAQAATYRYWTYWWGTNTATTHTGWKFASVGPSGQTVADQAVLGWRFATTSAAGTTKPRYASTYADICSDPKPAGTDVRVAVVVDFGSSSDWPPGEKPPVVGKVYTRCLTVAAGTRASAVMGQAQLDLRVGDNGLICGIDGFPSHECAPVVTDPKPTPKPTPRPTPTPTPTPTATHAPAPAASATTSTPGAAATTGSTAPVTPTAVTTAATSPSTGTTPSDGALAGTGDSPSPTDALLPATTEAPVASAAAGASSTPWGAVGGVALVALVGGAAWWTMRRGGAR